MSETFTERSIMPLETAELAQISLLERFSDEVVTFRGVTAPLGALVNLCPIPKDQLKPEKVEEYASNILQESGFDMSRIENPAITETAKKK